MGSIVSDTYADFCCMGSIIGVNHPDLESASFFFFFFLNQLVGHQHRDPINSPDELKQEKKKDFGVVARDIKIKIIDMFVQINWYEFVFYSA